MKRIGRLFLLIGAMACAHAVGPRANNERISVNDPICGFPGTRSGSLKDILEYDDPRVTSTALAHIVGEIVNVDGIRVRYATVHVPNTLIGAHPDSSGIFRMNVAPGTVVLQVRAIGHLKQEHTLHLIGGRTDTLCIRLRGEPVGLPPTGFNDVFVPTKLSAPPN